MEKSYELEFGRASCGRTLWNNLVVGLRTDKLEQREGYKRLTLPGLAETKCSFAYAYLDFAYAYLDIAEITITYPNSVEIKAENDEAFRRAESDLKKICEEKGVPLVDLN